MISESERRDYEGHPDYYKGSGSHPIEVFEIIDQFGLDFYLGNVVKYIARAGRKSGNTKRQDLEKAAHYIDEAIIRLGGNHES